MPIQRLTNEEIEKRLKELRCEKSKASNHYVPLYGEAYITVGGCKYPAKGELIDWDLYEERVGIN